jgi:hypothetical protein
MNISCGHEPQYVIGEIILSDDTGEACERQSSNRLVVGLCESCFNKICSGLVALGESSQSIEYTTDEEERKHVTIDQQLHIDMRGG